MKNSNNFFMKNLFFPIKNSISYNIFIYLLNFVYFRETYIHKNFLLLKSYKLFKDVISNFSSISFPF